MDDIKNPTPVQFKKESMINEQVTEHDWELTSYHQAHIEIRPRLAAIIIHHITLVIWYMQFCACSTYIDELQQDE